MTTSDTIWLAWAGWRLRMPALWRPLSIEGTLRRGKLMLGDSASALLQIKWWRPDPSQFQAEEWLAKRARPDTMTKLPGGPRPAGFEQTAWIKQTDPAGPVKFIWYGIAAEAGLVLEAALNGALPNRELERIRTRILPTLSVSRKEEPVKWAVFGASFTTPAGFDIKNRRLQLGDIALEMVRDAGRRLLLRQVYPAKLALERRSMRHWLLDSPIKEYRGFRGRGKQPEDWTPAAGQGKGLRWTGNKQLNFPLGWCGRRRSERAIVHDEKLDRLLFVECDSKQPDTEPIVRDAIEGMNWTEPGPQIVRKAQV